MYVKWLCTVLYSYKLKQANNPSSPSEFVFHLHDGKE